MQCTSLILDSWPSKGPFQTLRTFSTRKVFVQSWIPSQFYYMGDFHAGYFQTFLVRVKKPSQFLLVNAISCPTHFSVYTKDIRGGNFRNFWDVPKCQWRIFLWRDYEKKLKNHNDGITHFDSHHCRWKISPTAIFSQRNVMLPSNRSQARSGM